MFVNTFLKIIILIFIFQSLSKADDIRDFEIEGISIGDSLLDHFSIQKIEKNIKSEYYKDIPNFNYLPIEIENISSFEKYFGIQVHVKKNDLKFIVQGLSGYNYYKENITECYEQMEIIKKQFDNMFSNLRSQENVLIHPGDPSGKSTIKYVYYYFENGDVVSINCYDWSDEMPYWDNLDISLDTKDFYKAASEY